MPWCRVLAGVAVLLTAPAAGVAAVLWPLAMVALMAGAHLMAAFRGLPPVACSRRGRPWCPWRSGTRDPLLLTIIGGVAASALLTRSSASNALMVLALASYAAVAFGRRRVRLLDEGHRT